MFTSRHPNGDWVNARRPRHLVTTSGNITALDGRLFWRPIKACFRLFGRKKGPFQGRVWIEGHANGKMQLTFGRWVGGEIENGSQKVNNYVVFPRVSMIIPATHSRFFIYFPHRWQQNFQTFGGVKNTTLNSLVKIKMIWLYQRVPDIRHGIFDLIFCRITPQIRVPRNCNHFSTERNHKKRKGRTHTP